MVTYGFGALRRNFMLVTIVGLATVCSVYTVFILAEVNCIYLFISPGLACIEHVKIESAESYIHLESRERGFIP
jgi:hypothetical protein